MKIEDFKKLSEGKEGIYCTIYSLGNKYSGIFNGIKECNGGLCALLKMDYRTSEKMKNYATPEGNSVKGLITIGIFSIDEILFNK